VLLSVLASWHPRRDDVRRVIQPPVPTVGHCVVEVYSVLTRLPEPFRVAGAVAAQALDMLLGEVIVLEPAELGTLPGILAAYGVTGGATYDGLIAATVAAHGGRLLTLDARAAGTYRACGATFELL